MREIKREGNRIYGSDWTLLVEENQLVFYYFDGIIVFFKKDFLSSASHYDYRFQLVFKDGSLGFDVSSLNSVEVYSGNHYWINTYNVNQYELLLKFLKNNFFQ